MSANLKVKKGEIILFSSGQYSDYSYCGEIIFIKDCDLVDFVQKNFIGKNRFEGYCETDLASCLVANEYALPLQSREIHLGAYGCFDDDFGIETDEDFSWQKKDKT